MCRTAEWLALARQAQWEQEDGAAGDTAALLRLHELAELDGADPLACPDWIDLHRRVAGSP
jgi:hypothetical protein